MLAVLHAQMVSMRNNRLFESTVIAVIIISALEIGAKTFQLAPTANRFIDILDLFVTLFFVFELSIRFMAEPRYRDFFRSGWNLFDTLIVIASLVPMDNADMALLARLLRIFRVLRMISVLPELRTLINSLLAALPQLGYVVLLMFIIFYIYAAVGSFVFAGINPDLWDNVAISMLTLFRVMTFEDWTDIMYETMVVYPLSWSYYISFIFFTAFAFLNMVIGIVVNVMEEETEKNRSQTEPSNSELLAEIRRLNAAVEQLSEERQKQ